MLASGSVSDVVPEVDRRVLLGRETSRERLRHSWRFGRSVESARSVSVGELVGLHLCELGVEDRVLGLLDRRVCVFDCERGVLVRPIGLALRRFTSCSALWLSTALADRGDLLVPLPLQVVPPRGELALALLGLRPKRLGLCLRRSRGS